MGKLLATKAVILIRGEGKSFRLATAKGISKGNLPHDVTLSSVRQGKLRVDKTISPALHSCGITLLFPIISQRTVVGYFGVSEQPLRPLTAAAKKFTETLLSVSATAIEKGISFDHIKTINRTLDEKVHQLKTLFELAKEFSGILDQQRLLKLFSLTLMGQVGTNRFAIIFKEGKSIYSKISGAFLESDASSIFQLTVSPMLTVNIPAKKQYRLLKEHLAKERIVALVPLQIQNEVRGVLCLGDRLRKGSYSISDLEFIYSLANLAFVSIENSRLFEETIEKKRLESELLVAREIQRALLPQSLPVISGYEVEGMNISSDQVGGDYFDVIPSPQNTYTMVIGDVSGKGTPASLLMANLQASVHALIPFNLDLPTATARINDLIFRNTGTDKFITFFWGSLDPVSRTFRYVNAGHNPPFLIRADGRVERLTEGGLILGVMHTVIPYQEGSVTLSSGDSVIMYTDGVSEAMDVQGNDYSEERLESFVGTLTGLSAPAIVEALKKEIGAYTAGAAQSDDFTLVVFKAK